MRVAYGDLPVIDLALPDWWRAPHEVTRPMHESNAVAAYVPGFDTVTFLRYDDCLAILRAAKRDWPLLEIEGLLLALEAERFAPTAGDPDLVERADALGARLERAG